MFTLKPANIYHNQKNIKRSKTYILIKETNKQFINMKKINFLQN